jgi:hypothetical protein
VAVHPHGGPTYDISWYHGRLSVSLEGVATPLLVQNSGMVSWWQCSKAQMLARRSFSPAGRGVRDYRLGLFCEAVEQISGFLCCHLNMFVTSTDSLPGRGLAPHLVAICPHLPVTHSKQFQGPTISLRQSQQSLTDQTTALSTRVFSKTSGLCPEDT